MSRRARQRRDKRQPWQDQDDNTEARESGISFYGASNNDHRRRIA